MYLSFNLYHFLASNIDRFVQAKQDGTLAFKLITVSQHNKHNPHNKTTKTVLGLGLSNRWETTHQYHHTNIKLYDWAEIEQY